MPITTRCSHPRRGRAEDKRKDHRVASPYLPTQSVDRRARPKRALYRSGGGFAGIHSASDTEYRRGSYGRLVGAYFESHPEVQQATIHIEDRAHPSTKDLPTIWQRTDEWYNFRSNPRSTVHVLVTPICSPRSNRHQEQSYEPTAEDSNRARVRTERDWET